MKLDPEFCSTCNGYTYECDRPECLQHFKPVSPEKAAQIDSSLGLQQISIRLQKTLIEDFKKLAATQGLGYQPLMRMVLTDYAKKAPDTITATIEKELIR